MQRVPQAPQLFTSVWTSRQTFSQLVRPPPQETTQRPAVQTSPDPHALPQAPQPRRSNRNRMFAAEKRK